jgi:hypothetical protein
MIDWLIEQKLRFQRGTGHVSYLMAIVSIYTAMRVTLSSQSLPTWVYGLIPIIYVVSMWSIGKMDEHMKWSQKETAVSRSVSDPVLLKIASDVEEIRQLAKK